MRLAVHVVARAPRRPDRRMRNVDHSAAAERSLRRACPSRKLLADMTAASAEAIMLKQTGCMSGCRPDPPYPAAGQLFRDPAPSGALLFWCRPRRGPMPPD